MVLSLSSPQRKRLRLRTKSPGHSTGAESQPEADPVTPQKNKRLRRAEPPHMERLEEQGDASSSTDTALGYPLVAREAECKKLDGFLEDCFVGGRSGSLYVSGGPGTGKTCCVQAAASAWRRRHPETKIVKVNCFDLSKRSVAGLWQHLTGAAGVGLSGEKLTMAVAERLALLGSNVVVIVDEADQLISRQASHALSALETLLSLPRMPGAPSVALIAIANAVDLLQRTSVPISQGICRCLLFEPYGIEQLRSIGKARLTAAGSIGERASADLGRVNLEVCVRRLASRSGDCRQLVRLCEQAVRQARADDLEKPGDDELPASQPAAGADAPETPSPLKQPKKFAGLREVQVDPLRSVGELPLEQQVLLCALAAGKGEAVPFKEICARFKEFHLRLHQTMPLAKEQVRGALLALEQRGLLMLRECRISGSGRGRGGRGSGPSGGGQRFGGGDSVAELAVSRGKVRESLTEANAMLAQCLE